mgnify:CR=1 FL=1
MRVALAAAVLLLAAAVNVADIVAWEIGLEPIDLARGAGVLLAFAAGSIFNLVFWSAIVHLLLVYPVRSPWLRRWSWLVPAIYVGAAVVAVGALAALGIKRGRRLDQPAEEYEAVPEAA